MQTPPPPRDALEGKGTQWRPQKRLDRRLEEVAKAVGGGYCRLQMPLKLALGVRETVAGHRLRALEGGGVPPPFQCIPAPPPPPALARATPLSERQQVLFLQRLEPPPPMSEERWVLFPSDFGALVLLSQRGGG